MKSLLTIIATVALSGAALAGPVSYKNPKAPVLPPPAPTGCECFAPGFSFGAFGGALFDNVDDVLGGGILAEYAFSPYVAVQGSYGLYASESEHHQFDAALILRDPITSLCLAPYAMVGGGFSTNSDTSGDFLVGGGVDLRLPSASCMSIFADGAWYVLGDSEDQTIVRLGVKFPF